MRIRTLLPAVALVSLGVLGAVLAQESDGDAPASRPAAAAAEVAVPPTGHAVAPEAAVEIVRGVVEARAPATRPGSRGLEASRAALDALASLPLADPTVCERIKMRNGPDWFVLGWRSADGAITLDDVYAPVDPAAEIEAVDFTAELDEVVRLLRGVREGRRLGAPLPIVGWRRLDSSMADRVIRYALWAGRLGRADDARLLVEGALDEWPGAVADLLRAEVWRSYVRGALLLEGDGSLADVLRVWTGALEFSASTQQDRPLRDLVDALGRQVAAGEPSLDTEPPASATPGERAKWLVERFVAIRGELLVSPGDAFVLHCGEGTRHSDAAVALGADAVPALLDALDDDRLTRTVHRAELGMLTDSVFRVRDVALACLRAIAGADFTPRIAPFESMTPEELEAAPEKIRAMWQQHASRPPGETLLVGLRAGDVHRLRTIEEQAPDTVDALATLRDWADELRGDALVAVVEDLARRGDRSFIPLIEEMLHQAEERPPWSALRFVLNQGDVDDVRLVLTRMRRDRARGARSGEGRYYPGAATCASEVRRPEVVPLLVEVLGEREMSGSRYVPSAETSVAFGPADSAIEALIELTEHDPGYDAGAPTEKRLAAIDRWREWWESGGAREFAARHPQVADLIVAPEASAEQVGAALDGDAVDVPSRTAATAVYSVPSAGVRELLSKGVLRATVSPTGGVDLAFRSSDAEAAWFARASASDDGVLPALRIGLAEGWVDTRGRIWFRAHHAARDLMRYDGRFERIARMELFAATPGADGALVVIDDGHRVHLFDDEGTVSADSFAALAQAQGTRLRRAVPSVATHRNGYRRFVLTRDAAERIWWWDDHEGLLALDGDHVVRGPMPALRVGAPSQRRIDALVPLPDGRVAALGSEGRAAILTVDDGEIVVGDPHFSQRFVQPFPDALTRPDGTVLVAGRPLGLDGEKRPRHVGPLVLAIGPGGAEWRVAGERMAARAQIVHVAADGQEASLQLSTESPVFVTEPDGADAAWVLVKGAVLRVERIGGELRETHRVETDSWGGESLHSAGPGRVWVVPTQGLRRAALCVLLEARR